MSQYPIEADDSAAIAEGLNYLLSGPSGLGQNFQGVYIRERSYVTGQYRQPFTAPTLTTPLSRYFWYVDIPVNAVTPIGGATSRLIKFTFTAAQPQAPFVYGLTVQVSGTTAGGGDPGFYNDTWKVWDCTTTDVTFVTTDAYTWPALVTGGTVGWNYDSTSTYILDPAQANWRDTDCNARVTISNGNNDQVFISGQVVVTANYDSTSPPPGGISMIVAVNRYKGFPTNSATNNDYLFEFDATIAEKVFTDIPAAGPGTIGGECNFISILDSPNFGYYWYIIDIAVYSNNAIAGGDLVWKEVILGGGRSFTAQVIKQ